jgi:hypothetical protein
MRTARRHGPWARILLAAFGAAALASGALVLRARAAGPPVIGKLTWLGQSAFVLETETGTRIVMDPIPKGIGYDLPAGLKADAITISHEHADHNNVGLVVNKARVLRGLTPDKKGWTKIDEKVKDVAIRSVGVYHDDQHGAARGLNTVFLFEVGGLRIAHLGDLGHLLTDDEPHRRRAVGDRLRRRRARARGRLVHDRRVPGDARHRPAAPAAHRDPHALPDGGVDDQGARPRRRVPRAQGQRPPRADEHARAHAREGAARRADRRPELEVTPRLGRPRLGR